MAKEDCLNFTGLGDLAPEQEWQLQFGGNFNFHETDEIVGNITKHTSFLNQLIYRGNSNSLVEASCMGHVRMLCPITSTVVYLVYDMHT